MAEARPTALITGANGGMGRACARRFGAIMDLVLTDIAAPLASFAGELADEGYTVAAAITGDIRDDAVIAEAVARSTGGAGLGAVVDAAGLSPAFGGWQDIMTVNLVATEKLLRAIEPVLRPGVAAVLIASIAGHMMPLPPEVAALFADPLDPALIDKLAPIIDRMADRSDPKAAAGISYSLSKRAVIEMCEARAVAWGKRGARIVSISPGMISTPMGRKEAGDPGAAALLAMTPADRWGGAIDIAEAAFFLASPAAGFISGSDLRVDGGVVGALHNGAVPDTAPLILQDA